MEPQIAQMQVRMTQRGTQICADYHCHCAECAMVTDQHR